MNIFYELGDFIAELLFPNKCIFCDEVIPIGCEKWICPQCEDFMHISTESMKGVLYLYGYNGYVKDMLHRFKYSNHSEYAVKLGTILAERIKYEMIEDAHIIIPVPMHKRKVRIRGYNQAELLAEEMGKRLDISVDAASLVRSKYTKAQSRIKMSQRSENVKNVFKVTNKEAICGKNIILVDDIYTSGSTMLSCANELKKAGAGKIYMIVVALAGKTT